MFDEWLDEQDERGRLIVDPPHDPTAEEALPGTFAPPWRWKYLFVEIEKLLLVLRVASMRVIGGGLRQNYAA